MATVSSSGKISRFFRATKHSTSPSGKSTLLKTRKPGSSPVRHKDQLYVPSTLLTPDASPESDTNSGGKDELGVKEEKAAVLENSLKCEAIGVEPPPELVTLSGGCSTNSTRVTNLFMQDPPSQMLPDLNPVCIEALAEVPQAFGAGQKVEHCQIKSQVEEVLTDKLVPEAGQFAKPLESVKEVHLRESQPAISGAKKPLLGRKRGQGRGNRSATSRALKSEADVTKDSPGPAKSKKDKRKDDDKSNHKITEYFTVRRSERKCLSQIKRETMDQYKHYVLSENEDGLKKVDDLEGKGRGVIAIKPFLPGDFVVEYAGELIDKKTAEERDAAYRRDESVGCYMYYFIHNNKHYCVDATAETPRLGRLMNHSKKANNCRPKILEIRGKPHLIFVAHRYIEAGEELLYDYGDNSRAAMEGFPWLKS